MDVVLALLVTVEEEQGNAVFAIYFAVKSPLTSCNAVLIAKLTETEWLVVLQ